MIIPVTCRSVDKPIYVVGTEVLISVLPSRLLLGGFSQIDSQPSRATVIQLIHFFFIFLQGKLFVVESKNSKSTAPKRRRGWMNNTTGVLPQLTSSGMEQGLCMA